MGGRDGVTISSHPTGALSPLPLARNPDMPQSREISFVTYPDGQVDEASVTVCGETIARQRFVSAWLPDRFFGPSSGYALDTLWRGAREKGARSYTITIGADGQPTLKES